MLENIKNFFGLHKTFDLEKGKRYISISDNPFEENSYIEVLEIKNGYVKYSFINNETGQAYPASSSATISCIKSLYKPVEWYT